MKNVVGVRSQTVGYWIQPKSIGRSWETGRRTQSRGRLRKPTGGKKPGGIRRDDARIQSVRPSIFEATACRKEVLSRKTRLARLGRGNASTADG
ncbi:MAG: hypothetical protein D6741_19040, partial [Planctomycetota bacterium]